VALARQRSRAPHAPPVRAPRARPAARPAAATAGSAAAPRGEEPLAATGTDDDTWEPVPVPRPTYTLKPPAPVEIPSDLIDPLRDTDPHNTMAAAFYDEAIAPGSEVIAAEEPEVESDLDEILDRRWAVND